MAASATASRIDPLYVDTIVRRFEAVTGIKAVHLQTGMTFAELAVIRGQEAGTEAADAEAGAHADAEVTTRQPPNGSGSCCSSDELPLIFYRQRSRNRITPEVANV